MGLFNTLLEMYGNILSSLGLFLSLKSSLTTRFYDVDGIYLLTCPKRLENSFFCNK